MLSLNRKLFNQLMATPNGMPWLVKTLSTTQKCFLSDNNNGAIQNVTVMGGGIMGSGIAQVCAQSGFKVTIFDHDDESNQKCMVSILKSLNIISMKKFPHEPKTSRKFIDNVISNIKTTQHLERGCENADLVIEALVEDLQIKQQIFTDLDHLAPNNALFASNTSSLLIEDISKSTTRPDKFVGLHFFNPVWKMRAVEVIKTTHTTDNTYNTVLKFCQDLGKVPVTSPDQLGFIVNRLLFPYLMEALRFLERGHSTITDVDEAMKLGAGYPIGPFKLMDVIGLDTVKLVIDGWHAKEPNNPMFYPSDILNKLVAEQKLGQKTGIGFYEYKHTLY